MALFLYIGGMPAQTVAVWQLDPDTLDATKVDEATGLFSPSFLCAHPSLPLLYAAERRWSNEEPDTGAVTTFAIDPSSGSLRAIHRCRSGGAFTAHVNVSADGLYLTTANPRGPTIALFALNAQGVPGDAPDIIVHDGRGATEKHAEPWPHSAFFDRAIMRVLACDMALDRVFIHDLDRATGRLVPAPQPFVQVSSGAGARHLATSPDGRFIYVVNELDSTLSVFAYDAAVGRTSIVQTISTVPAGCEADNQPAEIVIAPDGRTLYITNRGLDTIAVFALNVETGRVALIDNIMAQGKSPRHITMSTDGALLAICNQNSNAVRLFRTESGACLRDAGISIPFVNPTCARFVEIHSNPRS